MNRVQFVINAQRELAEVRDHNINKGDVFLHGHFRGGYKS